MARTSFVAYAKLTPELGHRRRVLTNWIERVKKRLDYELDSAVARALNIYVNPDSVLVKPQFGQFPARATITGWYELEDASQHIDRDTVDAPATSIYDNYVGEPGKIVQGYRSRSKIVDSNVNLSAAILSNVADLKTNLETLSSLLNQDNIYMIDFQGFKFGEDGYAFP